MFKDNINSMGLQFKKYFVLNVPSPDSSKLRVVVFVLETLSLKSVSLHLVVVEGADSVDIRSCGQLLQELLGVIQFEDLLEAVEVLSNVVLVLVDTNGLVDLPLHLRLYY